MEKEFACNRDWAENLEKGLDTYMSRLIDMVMDENADYVDTLSGEPYCGCEVCYYREMLFYVAPAIMRGQINGDIWLLPSENSNPTT